MIKYHHKNKDNTLILVKDEGTYFVYYYRNKELRKEVPFRSYTSAQSFIDKFSIRD
jgi:hypothetical protein